MEYSVSYQWLIDFLKESNDKEEKLREIKLARKNGVINNDEAIDLEIEFC